MMKKILVFVLLSTAIIACKNKSADQKGGQADEFKAFTEQAQKINSNVRYPDDLMQMLEISIVDFMPELINDTANSEKYSGNDVMAAANMGVYLVDGLYQYSSKEFGTGYKSILAAKNIATKLGMGPDFDALIIERYNNLNPSVDTFLVKLNNCINSSEIVLKEQDKLRIFAGLLGGNYVEKQYILFNIIFKYNVDLPEPAKLTALREVIYMTAGQLKKLPELIALIESIKKESDSGIILDKLKEIEALHQQLALAEDPSKITPSQIFENKTLLAMFEKIKEVRTMIVAVPAAEAK
jgi:hypothetical protein